MAEMNWWKYSTGPSDTTKFYGSVDYVPWLGTKPSLTPAGGPGGDEKEQETGKFPGEYALSYNYPNPFNPVTQLRYHVPQPGGKVSITIYDVLGRRVKTLMDEHKTPGFYAITWNGRNDRGNPSASGIYFVRMKARNFENTKKILLLK